MLDELLLWTKVKYTTTENNKEKLSDLLLTTTKQIFRLKFGMILLGNLTMDSLVQAE